MAVLIQMPSTVAADVTDDGSFYSFRDAARLSLVHPSTLGYWVAVGVVQPSLRIVDAENRVIEHGFSLADVGYLHLIRHLRWQRVPLFDAVTFVSHLMNRFGPPSARWRGIRITRDGNKVIAYSPSDDWSITFAIPGKEGAGQKAWEELFTDLIRSIRDDAASLLIPDDLRDWVEYSPSTRAGITSRAGDRHRDSAGARLPRADERTCHRPRGLPSPDGRSSPSSDSL